MSEQKDNSGRKEDLVQELDLSKDLSKEKGLPEVIGELFLEGNPLHFLARLGVDIASAKRTIKNHNQGEKQINTLELSTKISPNESKDVKAFIETLEELKLFNIAYEKSDDTKEDNQIATPLDYTFLLLLDKDEIIRNADKMKKKFHQKMQEDNDPHLAAIRKGVSLRKSNPDDRNQKNPSEEKNLISSLSSAMNKMLRVSRDEDTDDENQVEELTGTNKPLKQQAVPPRAEPKPAEPPRAEPKRAESKRAEPPRAEPKRAEPKHAEPKRSEPKRSEPPRAEEPRAEPKRAEPQRAEPPRRAKPHIVETVIATRDSSPTKAPDIDNSKDIWEHIKASISQLDVNKVTGVANKHAIRQLKNFVDEKDKIHDPRAKELRLRAFDETAHRILNDLKTIKDPSVRDVIQALQIKMTPEKPGARPRRG